MAILKDLVRSKGSFGVAAKAPKKVALQRAAAETIRRGYDRFIVLGGEAETVVTVVGYTPTRAYSTDSATATGHGNIVTAQGSSTTTVTGGQPITVAPITKALS